MLYSDYYKSIQSILGKIHDGQSESIEQAAQFVSESILNSGIIHVFGCGHSHMLAEEVFYRAGGLVPVNAILEPALMLHTGAVKSSVLERMEGYASLIFERYDIKGDDILFIISNSGINSVPIEMAIEAAHRGIKVIGITSSSYFNEKSRHSSGQLLYQIVDLYIDNCVCKGDAVLAVANSEIKIGPASSIAGMFIINSIFVQAIEILAKNGIVPPVYMSGNIEGGEEHNEKLVEKYGHRLKHI